jgi:hypothetical protein
MWSTIVRYTNTFDRFDFYTSFIAKDKAAINMITASINDHFDFHLEDGDPIHPQARFVHIYSLPFAFDKLHGFISCSEFSSHASISRVRHLYLTQTRLARPVSFQSLAKYMPHLDSIHCNFSIIHGRKTNVSSVIFDRDIFSNVRFLCFTLHCWSTDCVCHSLLYQLLDRMPRLQCLITSDDALEYAWHPLPPIKRLDLRPCDFNSFDSLPKHVPHLTTLLFCYTISSVKELSRIIDSLYRGIPSLKIVSIDVWRATDSNRTSFEKIAEKALVRVQNTDNRLHYLTLNCEHGVAEFCLRKP